MTTLQKREALIGVTSSNRAVSNKDNYDLQPTMKQDRDQNLAYRMSYSQALTLAPIPETHCMTINCG
jgi:hypothetical protein